MMSIDKKIAKARLVLHRRAKGKLRIDPPGRKYHFRSVTFQYKNKPVEARFYKQRGKQQWTLDWIA